MKLEVRRYEDASIIQDLGLSFVFSNSERNELACKRKWYFSYHQQLATKSTSDSLLNGIAWHMLMEDLFCYWRDHDKVIDASHKLFVESFAKIRILLIGEGKDPEPIIRDMQIALEGYLNMYGSIHTEFRVLEVEVPLRFPIKNFEGDQFRSKVIVENRGSSYHIANYDSQNKEEIVMPFYVIGRADAIVQSRESGDLFIYDHKTTSSISRFQLTSEVDPQLHSYAAMLQYEKDHGYLQKYKNYKIGGVIYGLTNNGSTSEPKELKKGGLSKAKSNKIPSWVFEKAIQDKGFSRSDYIEHLESITKNVDPLWHTRVWLPLDSDSVERWKMESYGIARLLADAYHCIATIPDAQEWIAPRIPVCRTMGYCKFKEICVNDCSLLRTNYEKQEKIFWKKE